MQPRSPSVHHPFFVKCPKKPHFVKCPQKAKAPIWSLLRNSSWEICSLRESCGWADEVKHPAVLGSARYIINVFSLMSPYCGFRVDDWSSLIPGVSSPCTGLERACPPVSLFLSAWIQGEQDRPHADVQMKREQVSPGACLVSLVPCHAAGMWLLPVPREQTWPTHITAWCGDRRRGRVWAFVQDLVSLRAA